MLIISTGERKFEILPSSFTGAIQVVYAAMSSSSLGPESMLAEAPQDFSDDVMSVVMGDGVKAVEIEIPLNDVRMHEV